MVSARQPVGGEEEGRKAWKLWGWGLSRDFPDEEGSCGRVKRRGRK